MTDALLFHLIVEPQRNPHLADIKDVEIRRHYAYDRVRFFIECQLPAHDVRIGAESALPQTVFEHNHLIAPRLIFARQKYAPERRPYAERIEKAGGDAVTAESFRLMRSRQIEGAPDNGDEPLEAMILFTPVVEIAGRDRAVVVAALHGAPFIDHHQPLLMLKTERAQNQRIRDAEDRRIGRDPRRNRDDGNQRKAGILHQHSRAVTQVLQQVLQPPCPAGVAAPLLHLLRTAESEPSPSSRFQRIEALRDEIGCMLVQMEAQFFFEFLFHLPSEPQSSPPAHLVTPKRVMTSVHSHRRAIIGSTFVARRAGIQQANSAAPDSASEIRMNVSGSVGATPYSSGVIMRVSANAPAIPSANPASVNFNPCPVTSRTMSRDRAPSAMRTPIS